MDNNGIGIIPRHDSPVSLNEGDIRQLIEMEKAGKDGFTGSKAIKESRKRMEKKGWRLNKNREWMNANAGEAQKTGGR